MRILVMCAKFGCDMCAPLPAYENLTFQVLKSWTGNRSSEIGTLAEGRNGFVFTFLAEFALESCADGALHPGIPHRSIVDQPARGWLDGQCNH